MTRSPTYRRVTLPRDDMDKRQYRRARRRLSRHSPLSAAMYRLILSTQQFNAAMTRMTKALR